LCDERDRLDGLIAAMPATGALDPTGEIAAAFDRLRQTAADRFWDVDRSLKEVCESLGALEASLRSIAKGSR
jgi:hypothetical protein